MNDVISKPALQFYSTGISHENKKISAKYIIDYRLHFARKAIRSISAVQDIKSKFKATMMSGKEYRVSGNLFMLPENPLRAHLEARLEVGNGDFISLSYELIFIFPLFYWRKWLPRRGR